MRAATLGELVVYQKALIASDEVSAILTIRSLCEDRDLKKQFATAAAAVPANIAEGFGQGSDRQFANFLYIARGSCNEVRSHMAVAESRGYLEPGRGAAIARKYEEIARMATALARYLRKSDWKHRS